MLARGMGEHHPSCLQGLARLGLLAYGANPQILCAVPTTIDAEDELQVVDFGCMDFEILSR